MKVSIDREECIQCGACEAACPAVFELDEESIASIVEKYRTSDLGNGEIDDDLRSCIDNAVESCPVDVIHIK